MRARAARGLLWTMRLGILGMLAIAVSVLYHRHHLSPEQEELLRYGEIELPALRKVEGPLLDRLGALLSDRQQPAPVVRKTLVDEIVPGLVGLRQAAARPVGSHKVESVRRLAEEYLQVVEGYIDACRTAVRVIDDPRLDGRTALGRIGRALGEAIERQQRWEGNVRALSVSLRLSRP